MEKQTFVNVSLVFGVSLSTDELFRFVGLAELCLIGKMGELDFCW